MTKKFKRIIILLAFIFFQSILAADNDILIYGGSFGPIHKGHLLIMLNMMESEKIPHVIMQIAKPYKERPGVIMASHLANKRYLYSQLYLSVLGMEEVMKEKPYLNHCHLSEGSRKKFRDIWEKRAQHLFKLDNLYRQFPFFRQMIDSLERDHYLRNAVSFECGVNKFTVDINSDEFYSDLKYPFHDALAFGKKRNPPKGVKYKFLAGMDTFRGLDSWEPTPETLSIWVKAFQWVVLPRPDEKSTTDYKMILQDDNLDSFFPKSKFSYKKTSSTSSSVIFSPGPSHKGFKPIEFLTGDRYLEGEDISSTEIRNLLQGFYRQKVPYDVNTPRVVPKIIGISEDFIKSNRIFRDKSLEGRSANP